MTAPTQAERREAARQAYLAAVAPAGKALEAAWKAYLAATEAAEKAYMGATEPALKAYRDALRTIEEAP